MSEKYAKVHGIDCACDVCAHVEKQWGEAERALAEARSRRQEPGNGSAPRNPVPHSWPASEPAGAPTDDVGEDG